MSSLLLEWDDIVIKEIGKLKFLPLSTIIISELDKQILEIFDVLKRLENKKFYLEEDVENIFCFISLNVFYMNDILVKAGNAVLVNVYQLILNIFDKLIKIAAGDEEYETAQNLLRVRDYWYNYLSIKIKKKGAEK
jgi:hypothetical protein